MHENTKKFTSYLITLVYANYYFSIRELKLNIINGYNNIHILNSENSHTTRIQKSDKNRIF